MDIRHLEVLVAIADERSFTRAAGKLHITQSAMSQLVKRIEGELGFAVFDRGRSPIEPTEAGRRFLPQARTIVHSYARALDVAQGADGGAPLTLGAAPTLARELFPRVLELAAARALDPAPRLVEASSGELGALLARGLVDVVALASTAATSAMAYSPILRCDIVAVAGAAAFGGDRDVLSAADLARRPLLLPKAGGVRTHLSGFLAGMGDIDIAFESTSSDSLVGMAAIGAGVALVPELVVSATMLARFPEVRVLRIHEGPPPVETGIGERQHHPHPSRVSVLRELVRDAFAACHPELVLG